MVGLGLGFGQIPGHGCGYGRGRGHAYGSGTWAVHPRTVWCHRRHAYTLFFPDPSLLVCLNTWKLPCGMHSVMLVASVRLMYECVAVVSPIHRSTSPMTVGWSEGRDWDPEIERIVLFVALSQSENGVRWQW
jgi:hypothetical protein